MSLLDGTDWQGKIFDGSWRPAAQRLTSVEPATGKTVGTVGPLHRKTSSKR